jgi:aminoglycoside 2'-N-acetyltransferase I
MFQISQVINAELNSEIEPKIKYLLDSAFEGDFSAVDWDHTFGGVRFLGFLNGELIAHGAVIRRWMEVDGLRMPVGYVEGIAVSPAHWRNGFGSLLMAEVTEYCKRVFQLSMLSTDEKDFYRKHGWIDFEGNSYVIIIGIESSSYDEDEGLMCLSSSNQVQDRPRRVVCESRSEDAW